MLGDAPDGRRDDLELTAWILIAPSLARLTDDPHDPGGRRVRSRGLPGPGVRRAQRVEGEDRLVAQGARRPLGGHLACVVAHRAIVVVAPPTTPFGCVGSGSIPITSIFFIVIDIYIYIGSTYSGLNMKFVNLFLAVNE